jgi:hypothetical protein
MKLLAIRRTTVGWKSNRSSNDKVWPMFTKDDPNEILMGYEYEIDVNVDKLELREP